jgi:hypothetical protein
VVVSTKALDQLRLAFRSLGGGEREPGRIDPDKQEFEGIVGIARTIHPGRTDRQGPYRRLVTKHATRHPALDARRR